MPTNLDISSGSDRPAAQFDRILPCFRNVSHGRFFRCVFVVIWIYQCCFLLTAIGFLVHWVSFPYVMVCVYSALLQVWTLSIFLSHRVNRRFDDDATFCWALVVLVSHSVLLAFLCALGVSVAVIGIERIAELSRVPKEAFFTVLYGVAVPLMAYLLYIKVVFLWMIKAGLDHKKRKEFQLKELVMLTRRSQSRSDLVTHPSRATATS